MKRSPLVPGETRAVRTKRLARERGLRRAAAIPARPPVQTEPARCLCCRTTFASWDRRRNRLCQTCTGFSPSPYAPPLTPEVEQVTANGFHVAGFGA